MGRDHPVGGGDRGLRIAELLLWHLEDAKRIVAPYAGSWIFYVNPGVLRDLCDELDSPLDELHGEDLVPTGVPEDTVLLMSRTKVDVEALRVYPSKSFMRVVFIPPEDLTLEQCEVFQALRADGSPHVEAAGLARLLA